MARSSMLDPITLHASATRTGTTKSATDTAYTDPIWLGEVIGHGFKVLMLILDVTAGGTESGDALDVTVQARMDRDNWVDICAFTQTLGDDPVKMHIAKIRSGAAENMFTDAALTAGNVRHLIGEQLRVKYAITNDADDPVDTTFTFAVTAVPTW